MHPRLRDAVTGAVAFTAGGAAWYKADTPGDVWPAWIALAAAWVFLFFVRAPAENDRAKVARLEAANEMLRRRLATEEKVWLRRLTYVWDLVPDDVKTRPGVYSFKQIINGAFRRKSDRR